MAMPADVRSAIDELRICLRAAPDEGELLRTVQERIAALREVYRRDGSLFTADDVHFLRGLTPLLRALRSFLEEKRRREVEARVAELEQTPRRCLRNHRMAIREGPRGHFWGCSTYPFCRQVALLSADERAYLAGDDRCAPGGLANARQLALV